MERHAFISWSVVALLSLGGISCNESLPPYLDPVDVFESSNEALYAIRITDNSLKAFVNIVNLFDDTFDGKALVEGTVTVEWKNDMTFKKTFKLGPASIIHGNYNPSTNNLTVDPGDTLRLGVSWNFTDDNGRNIRNVVQYSQDSTCQQRWLSDTLTFVIRSQVKIFEKTGVVFAPSLTVAFQHHREYFADQFCTPLPPN